MNIINYLMPRRRIRRGLAIATRETTAPAGTPSGRRPSERTRRRQVAGVPYGQAQG